MVKEAVVFNALGDETRLAIIKKLSVNKYFTITEVSTGLHITRQGVRRHLQVLADAELLYLEPRGRDTVIHLNPATLEKAKTWITKLEHEWDNRLKALKSFVEGG